MFEEILEIYRAKVEEIEKEKKEAQSMILLVSAMEKISQEMDSKQSDIDLIGRLIDQVDRLSKEVSDLKSQFKARKGRAMPVEEASSASSGERTALDKHARSLIDIMMERPGIFTTNELVDMLGLNKTTVINVMKRAYELDPIHVKMSQGKRRKLYLSYVSDDEGLKSEVSASSEETDPMKMELMAMT